MNTNAKMFWILFAFFIVADATYITWSLLYSSLHLETTPSGVVKSPVEWVGAVGIGLAGILSAFLAFYLGRTQSGVGAVLPEDRLDADIDDGDPEQGFFSPWSWWPISMAAGAALLFLGIAVGVWIAFIGAAVVIVSLVGWTYEYYRGNFAH